MGCPDPSYPPGCPLIDDRPKLSCQRWICSPSSLPTSPTTATTVTTTKDSLNGTNLTFVGVSAEFKETTTETQNVSSDFDYFL